MMNFEDIARNFEQGKAGTDSFKTLWKDSFELMKEDRENAALYFTIGQIARAYVLVYEDQAVKPEMADHAKHLLEDFNQRLLKGLSGTPQERLELLSSVAYDYEWTINDF